MNKELFSGSMEKATNTEAEDVRPNPLDFDRYLPWACSQLQVDVSINVTKIVQQEYVSASAMSEKNKSKLKSRLKPPSRSEFDSKNEPDNTSITPFVEDDANVLNILAIYDANDNLVQLKFDKNKKIPRIVLKVIGLIIQYQIYLTTISFNKGIDKYTIYETCKFLPLSHITDICLDSCFLKEANYHMLLEQPNFIRQLSLARCCISDGVVETLAEMLVYPQPASKTLSILNLSSNRITDIGAKHLAEVLRSNRQLSYLNLADNMITDTGAETILNTLTNFPLFFNELLTSRSRHMTYLKEKNELMIRIAKELRAGDLDRRSAKQRLTKPSQVSKKPPKGLGKEPSNEFKSTTNMDAVFLEKASIMAETTLGEFKDPFSESNTFMENEIVYSYGNNSLCYLNLSYNSLSYTSVKKLLHVLRYQRSTDRSPKGLMNISIEGNSLPEYCREFSHIDYILYDILSSQQRKMSMHKKKSQSGKSAK